MFKYIDPASGETFEFQYIVTQTEAEGPERLEYRNENQSNWMVWPNEMPVPSEVNAHFHGERVPWDFDVPSFFDAFSAIRAVRDDLKLMRSTYDLTTKPMLAMALEVAVAHLTTYGDLDENYSSIAETALKGDAVARGELERISSNVS